MKPFNIQLQPTGLPMQMCLSVGLSCMYSCSLPILYTDITMPTRKDSCHWAQNLSSTRQSHSVFIHDGWTPHIACNQWSRC